MRLLISGATGYIGTHLRKRLDQLHIDYDILSRESSCSVKQNDENVKFYTYQDIAKERISSEYDALIHLAGVIKGSKMDFFNANVELTKRLILFSQKKKIKRFIFLSSTAALFDGAKGGYYAQTKKLAENVVRSSGLNYAIIRPAAVYGMNSKSGLNLFINKIKRGKRVVIPGDGEYKIRPAYLGDVVEAIMKSSIDKVELSIDVNICQKEETSLNDFLQIIAEKFKAKLRVAYVPLGLMKYLIVVQEKILGARAIVLWEQVERMMSQPEVDITQLQEKLKIESNDIREVPRQLL